MGWAVSCLHCTWFVIEYLHGATAAAAKSTANAWAFDIQSDRHRSLISSVTFLYHGISCSSTACQREAVAGSPPILNQSTRSDAAHLRRVAAQDVRGRIAAIPQEPILFSGTIRSNVDPYDQHEDHEIWTALERVDLKAGHPVTKPQTT